MKPTNTNSWRILEEQATPIKNNPDFNQVKAHFSLDLNGLKFDFTNQIFEDTVLTNLVELSDEMNLTKAVTDLLAGKQVNRSEKKPALHIGLRHAEIARDTNQYDAVLNQFEKMVEIEKSINHLQKTKEALMISKKHLLSADSKSQDLTVKKLTKNNPTMKRKFNNLQRTKD